MSLCLNSPTVNFEHSERSSVPLQDHIHGAPYAVLVGGFWARIRERADAPSFLLLLHTTHVHRFEHDDATDERGSRALPHTAEVLALATSKGRLIFCTVAGDKPNRRAILRTPSVRPGWFKALRTRSSSWGDSRGLPSLLPRS